ncbi:MAG: hypothetical protein FJZ38_18525 [Candidatus Rokubacteria bacterium]|nr:hypothetical protein [Candidatus Rokubacteria bacterium]
MNIDRRDFMKAGGALTFTIAAGGCATATAPAPTAGGAPAPGKVQVHWRDEHRREGHRHRSVHPQQSQDPAGLEGSRQARQGRRHPRHARPRRSHR